MKEVQNGHAPIREMRMPNRLEVHRTRGFTPKQPMRYEHELRDCIIGLGLGLAVAAAAFIRTAPHG